MPAISADVPAGCCIHGVDHLHGVVPVHERGHDHGGDHRHDHERGHDHGGDHRHDHDHDNRSELVAAPPPRGAVRDQCAGEVHKCEMILGDRLPTDSQGSKVVVPAVGSLDDPATWSSALARARLLATASEVGFDLAQPDLLLRIAVVVSLIETEMRRPTRTARCSERHGVQCRASHPLVMNVRAGQRDCNRDSSSIREHVPFRAKLSAISRIGPGECPPLGAFTVALSSEAQAQSMPRCSS
jgi:hypothetical protein